jgi:hypothetical protein
MKGRAEHIVGGIIGIALIALVMVVLLYVSGKIETVRVVDVDDNTRCAIVSRGSNVSIDCWVLEKQR